MSDVNGNGDLKPPPKLSGPQLEMISEAIVDGYDAPTLTRVLRFKMGVVLPKIVNEKQGFGGIVFDLLDWAEKRGKALEVLSVAYADNPDNQSLEQAAKANGLNLAEVSRKYDLKAPPPKPASLEAAVNRHSRFIDYGQFLTRFLSLGDRICKVETPDEIGTGFLIGPDLVLTNFHVVDTVLNDAEKRSQTLCRLDYKQDAEGKTYRLGAGGVLASRPYADSDITGVGEPEPEKLDYALLQLAEPVGNVPATGPGKRGWFVLGGEAPVLAVRDFIVIPQHPDGRHLEIAWGSLLAFNGDLTRVRHDVITDGGSSGSPCFTIDLTPFGLHHARDPEDHPTFNQAIPLKRIAKDIESKGIILPGAS